MDPIDIEAMREKIKRDLGPDEIEVILEAARALPAEWCEHSVQRNFQYLRCRLHCTQDEIAEKSGLTQSQVSHVESGADVRLSTLNRVYAAMGFKLVLVPVSPLKASEVIDLAERGRPAGHRNRLRSRPRRDWLWLESPWNPDSPFSRYRSNAMATFSAEGRHSK